MAIRVVIPNLVRNIMHYYLALGTTVFCVARELRTTVGRGEVDRVGTLPASGIAPQFPSLPTSVCRDVFIHSSLRKDTGLCQDLMFRSVRTVLKMTGTNTKPESCTFVFIRTGSNPTSRTHSAGRRDFLANVWQSFREFARQIGRISTTRNSGVLYLWRTGGACIHKCKRNPSLQKCKHARHPHVPGGACMGESESSKMVESLKPSSELSEPTVSTQRS